MKKRVIIQGEVVIKEIDCLPNNLPEESKDGVVAYGETGGAHALQSGKFNLYGNYEAATKYLKVHDTTELHHGHNTQTGHEIAIIAPGTYQIEPQKEVDVVENRIRTVLD